MCVGEDWCEILENSKRHEILACLLWRCSVVKRVQRNLLQIGQVFVIKRVVLLLFDILKLQRVLKLFSYRVWVMSDKTHWASHVYVLKHTGIADERVFLANHSFLVWRDTLISCKLNVRRRLFALSCLKLDKFWFVKIFFVHHSVTCCICMRLSRFWWGRNLRLW